MGDGPERYFRCYVEAVYGLWSTVIAMKCPICDKPVMWKDNPHRPFCSERCKLIDFGNWADENYAVPSEEAPPSTEGVALRQPSAQDERDES